jgi:hypothetical protein
MKNTSSVTSLLKNSNVTSLLTNKWVLNIVSFLALLNVIGYMVMGNFNNVIFFIVLAILVKYFSKNMIIILGVPLIIVNLMSVKNGYGFMEGFEGDKDKDGNKKKDSQSDIVKKVNDDKSKKDSATLPGTEHPEIDSANVKSDESFEVGRAKNKTSKIDYASTIEDAYDDLNKILGSDGIKRLTTDTQGLMKQQMELAKSMEAMTPLIEGIMPMAEKAQQMMKSMDSGNGSLGSVMEMAKKMSGGLATK